MLLGSSPNYPFGEPGSSFYANPLAGGVGPRASVRFAMPEDLHAARWPAELDAMIAAPHHHRLLLENDLVRVLDTRITPGEVVPLHTHRWPAVYYVLSPGDFVRRDELGRVLADSRASPTPITAGHALWSSPLAAHTLENVGATTIHIVSMEVKGDQDAF